MKLISLIKDENAEQFDSGIWFWEYSGKYVCINDPSKEIFTVLLTTDLRLSSI